MGRRFAKLKGHFRRILQLDDTPESIARGVALGLMIAMTPTVGVQMILVAIVHTLCRANRLAGFIMVYVSNPVTMLPIYWADYLLGSLILSPFSDAERLDQEDLRELFDMEGVNGFFAVISEFASRLGDLGIGVAGPLFLGGLVLGIVVALPSYPITLRLVRRERAWKRERQLRKSERLGIAITPSPEGEAAASAAAVLELGPVERSASAEHAAAKAAEAAAAAALAAEEAAEAARLAREEARRFVAESDAGDASDDVRRSAEPEVS